MAFEMSFGEGAGWGGDTSFATDTGKDSESVKVAEKLPVPVLISYLAGLTDEKVPYGEMHFATAFTIGDVVETHGDETSQQYVLADPQNTDVTFTIMSYDGVSADQIADEGVLPVVGMRIFVAGKMRSFDGRVMMVSYKIRTLDHELEYDCFVKEAEIARLYWEKNVPSLLRDGQATSLTGCAAGAPIPKDGSTAPSQSTNGHSTAATTRPTTAQTKGSTGPVKDQVLNLLREVRVHASDSDRKDLSVDEIVRRSGHNINAIKNALEDLSQDGLIYNSVDDDHYEAM